MDNYGIGVFGKFTNCRDIIRKNIPNKLLKTKHLLCIMIDMSFMHALTVDNGNYCS